MENQRYKIGRHPTSTASHNQRTWVALESRIKASSATFEELVGWCEGHELAGGGRRFVKYCIDRGRLVPAEGASATAAARLSASSAKDSSTAAPIVRHLGTPRPFATGVYIAYPTTHKLKVIYRGLKTMVNDQHTKVGITRDSFASRAKVYEETFDGEVIFMPIAEVSADLLCELERGLLFAMERRYQRVGKAREWFDTDDRATVIAAVKRVVEQSCR